MEKMTRENEDTTSNHFADEGVNNLIDVAWEPEHCVISCLERRLRAEKYYTWAGTTLVAVNPCKSVPGLYDETVRQQYDQRDLWDTAPSMPHAWAAAARAREQVRRGAGDQVLVVSGDSGAGKTHTAWLMLDFLASSGGGGGRQSAGKKKTCAGREALRLLRGAGPLLAAMGHARTQLNANSSRFGTLVTLRFTSVANDSKASPRRDKDEHASWLAVGADGAVLTLAGARVSVFLLEKTRAAAPAPGERNFHIFYQMLTGLTDSQRSQLRLARGKSFRIVPNAVAEEDDDLAAAFTQTQRCMQALASPQEAEALLRLLAALLHLGEVDFAQPHASDSDDYIGCGGGDCYPCVVDADVPGSLESLEAAASLLGVESSALETLLTSALVSASAGAAVGVSATGAATPRRRTAYRRLLATADECRARRDCLLRFLYARAFRWAVGRANARLAPQAHGPDIGVLDLFGFECLRRNSLEQLCINYAAERLQLALLRALGQRTRDAHEAAMEEASDEVHTALGEAMQRLRLLDGPISVFSVLDQETVLQRRVLASSPGVRANGDGKEGAQTITDAAAETRASALAAALHETLREHRFFMGERSAVAAAESRCFTIHHFAGDVSYDTRGLLEKNLDRVPAEFAEALTAGCDPIVADIVINGEEQPNEVRGETLRAASHTPSTTPRARPTLTLLSKFKTEVDALVARLADAETHHVRCLKASPNGDSGAVDVEFLRRQLASAGLLEALRCTQERFPVRIRIEDFRRRYGSLPGLPTPSVLGTTGDATHLKTKGTLEDVTMKETLLDVLAESEPCPLSSGDLRVGRRSVYLSESAAAALEAKRHARLEAAARFLQRAWRQVRQRHPRRHQVHATTTRIATLFPAVGGAGDAPSSVHTVYRGDRIVSRRPLAKAPIWFHTKVTCLPFSHVLPYWELPQGLSDLV